MSSWSDYGVPDTMSPTAWLDALIAAGNERLAVWFNGRIRRPRPCGNESFSSLINHELKGGSYSKGEFFVDRESLSSLFETSPDFKAWRDGTVPMPTYLTFENFLVQRGETDYFSTKLSRRFGREGFRQLQRYQNARTMFFPDHSSYDTKLYCHSSRHYGSGEMLSEAWSDAFATSPEYVFKNSFDQPLHYLSGIHLYGEEGYVKSCTVNCHKLAIALDCPFSADISAVLFPYIAFGRFVWGTAAGDEYISLPPVVRHGRMEAGQAELELITPEILQEVFGEYKRRQFLGEFWTHGVFFDFKTEDGFRFI